MYHIVYISCRKRPVNKLRQQTDACFEPVGKQRPYHIEGQPENYTHYRYKCRNRCVFARQHTIHPAASGVLTALLRLHHSRCAHLFYEAKPHIRDSRRSVKASLLLHLQDYMLQQLFLVVAELQALEYQPVTFGQLACGEPQRYPGCSRMVFYQMHYGVKTPVHSSVLFLGAAEIKPARPFLIFRDMHSVVHQLPDALASGCGNRNYRYTQHAFHLIYKYRPAVVSHLIHHIESKDHRNVELHELHCQIEISFYIGGIHYVDDALGIVVEHELPGYYFFTAVRGHRVYSRQIGDKSIVVSLYHPVLSVHGDSGEIAHMLVRSGELVEKSSLAAVLIPCQRKGHSLSVLQRIFIRLHVIPAAFSQTRMSHRLLVASASRLRFCISDIGDVYSGGVILSQRQLISVYSELHRISHWSVFYHRYICLRYQPHIEKMLPEGSVTSHGYHGGSLSYRQLPQCNHVSISIIHIVSHCCILILLPKWFRLSRPIPCCTARPGTVPMPADKTRTVSPLPRTVLRTGCRSRQANWHIWNTPP